MIIATHLELTQLIIDENIFKSLTGSQKRQLLFGSIQPDLAPENYFPNFLKTISTEHTFQNTYKETETLIIEVYKQCADGAQPNFYLLLGNISHFLADYFCSAHSPWYEKSTLKHLHYEFSLHHYLKENELLFKHKLYNIVPKYYLTPEAFIKHFKEQYQYYLNLLPSRENDLSFVLTILSSLYSSLQAVRAHHSKKIA